MDKLYEILISLNGNLVASHVEVESCYLHTDVAGCKDTGLSDNFKCEKCILCERCLQFVTSYEKSSK